MRGRGSRFILIERHDSGREETVFEADSLEEIGDFALSKGGIEGFDLGLDFGDDRNGGGGLGL